ncbi:MAG: hypothetical protein HC783_11930, partial [Rhodobacteraceae bacterium]|nr:hypothetical protein [Paracoccaceae bacterium]
MSTRDTMELKEETIRAQYEAALGMVFGFDHAPRLAKALVSAPAVERSPGVGVRPTFRSTVPGMAISSMGRVTSACPLWRTTTPSSRSERVISSTKNGLPSDFVAIFPVSSSARCSEPRPSRQQEHEVLRSETRQSDARHVLAAIDLREPRSV